MIYKEKIKSEDVRLNRHIYHDDRSKNFMFDTSGLEIIDVEHKRLIPVLNQGSIGSCTGNSGIGDINTEPFELNRKVYSPDEDGAIDLYSDATKIDEFGGTYPPTDTGSSGLAIAKVLKEAGLISSYQHTFTLNDALKALSKYPVITGTLWYDKMFTPDPDGRVHSTGVVKGGHEYQAYKVDTKLGRIWFYNSWGESWGIKGTFYLTWEDYANLLSQGGDVTVLIPPTDEVFPTTWKYFKSSEFTNSEHTHTVAELKVELVNLLDQMRGDCGFPFIITSGFRTVAENNKYKSAVTDSAHLTGEAVDIYCEDSAKRQKINDMARKYGINRIGIAKNFIHLDISKTLPQNVTWIY